MPKQLKESAGELVAALWNSAQRVSRAGLAQFQEEAAAAVNEAKLNEAQARAAQRAALGELEDARARTKASEDVCRQLSENLAAAATNAGLQARLDDLHQVLADTTASAERTATAEVPGPEPGIQRASA